MVVANTPASHSDIPTVSTLVYEKHLGGHRPPNRVYNWEKMQEIRSRKFTLWEEATRAPLVFVAPGVSRPESVCSRTVDFMSIYPTLCDLCGLSTPSQVLEIWKAEFDGSYRAGGCFLLVVHPFCIGRHPRIAMLRELIEYIEGHGDVWFATHLEVAEEWRRLQVEQGTWNPVMAIAER